MKRQINDKEPIASIISLIIDLEGFIFQVLHAADHAWALVVTKVICNVSSSSCSQQIGHDALRSLSC